jgi:bifunctional enzyme CysN/CysC
VADTPGHAQYTRNMATGASTASLAVLLVDARKGLQVQTRRHSRIVAMMGIRHAVLAVNKMDLVGFDQATFTAIVAEAQTLAAELGFASLQAIPLSALLGDNVMLPSAHMPWYTGPTLLDYLNTVDTSSSHHQQQPFRLPVQWVNRTQPDFRGFCGQIAAGTVQPGDAVGVLPSGVATQVKAVWRGFEEVAQAQAGDAVLLTLTDEVDVSRGDVLAAADAPPEVADQFEARLLWLSELPLVPGRQYLLKLACKEVTASVTAIKFLEDINTGTHLAAKLLQLNDIARVTLSTSAPLVFEPYAHNPTLGGFVLIDKLSCETVGAGMIEFALRRASNIHWQAITVNQAARAQLKQQQPCCIWLTGLSGSGKSTLVNLLEQRLHQDGRHTYVLDGDNLRHGLNRDLGFTEADRVENIRRVAQVARLMVDAGLIVLVSLISPYRADRAMARSLFAEGEFVEVFVDAPLATCEQRDVKGLYAKARRGELKNFTGIDSPYEAPLAPEVHLQVGKLDAQACLMQLYLNIK